MPYIIRRHNNHLLLVNHSVKNGLYSQTLSANGLSRPMIINRNNTSQYSVAVDHNEDLHIITQPSKEQVMHLHYKDNNITRNIILEDPKGIYNFSNLYAISAKEDVHLFYTANKPIGDSCELIHHILCPENKTEPCPILSFSSSTLGMRYTTYNDTVFLLYGEMSDQYLLQLMTYSDSKWDTPMLVATSSFPIDDFQFCIDHNGLMHLVYIQEKYGRYNLLYKRYNNDIWSDEIIIHTSSSTIHPAIFTYHEGLWINFTDDNKLQMILSMDYGNTFSKNVDCSLQTSELKRCHFISAPKALPETFNCNMLYASLAQSIRAGIISRIDMIHFHPDMKTNTELELFIDGVFHSLSKKITPAPASVPGPVPDIPADYSADIASLQAENTELKQVQEQMITQYNDMAELTKKIQEEGKRWRDKALALQSELESDDSNTDIPTQKPQDL